MSTTLNEKGPAEAWARPLLGASPLGVALCLALWGCSFDSSGLVKPDPELCGNGTLDPGEVCDGVELGGQTCEGLGLGSGTLLCTGGCQLDSSGCVPVTCGNGQIDAGEACDGQELGGETCEGLGLGSGTLACRPNCQLDTQGCVLPSCGNGQLDSGEECDDGNAAPEDDCLPNCRLARCGDGVVKQTDPAEACDDGETDPCTGSCNADCTGPANTCGDGIVRCGEACEAGDLQGQDCTDFGFTSPGGLVCAGCALDPSGCTDSCGDGVLDSGEACDDGNTAPSNGTDDFCGATCTTSAWACAGSWPGYLTPTNTAEAWVTWTGTVVGASTSGYATAAAGGTIDVSGHYEYDTVASGCTGCRVQLYWGFFAGDPPASDGDVNAGWQYCADYVNQFPSDDYALTMDVPTQPGTYYLRWGRGWDYGCNGVGDPPVSHSLAVICVH